MKKNGFTLVELLATITIMGLILMLISPSIKNLQNRNKQKKFEIYGKTLVDSAKLFVQREGDDITELGVQNWEGCVDITYQDLVKSNLIKKFADNDYDCSNSKVRLTKTMFESSYSYNLICTTTNTKKKNYSSVNIDDSQCTVSEYK